MLFSVIIPFHNCEKYLGKSIRSVMHQTLSSKHYELIVVNDLSKDKFNICVTRAGNVIGGGDWSQDRILPDLFKQWSKSKILKIRTKLRCYICSHTNTSYSTPFIKL